MFIALVVLVIAAVMIGIERVSPGRPWPRVRGWWIRAILLNAVQAGAVWLAGAVCTIVADHKNGVLHGGADARRPAYVLGW